MSVTGALAGDLPAGTEPTLYSDRICSPEVTLGYLMPLLEGCGVTRLARLTGLDRIGIPVWNAIRPNARSLAISQGKGITDLAARVSAGMEAYERAVAEQPFGEPLPATASELERRGIQTERLDGFVGTQQPAISMEDQILWRIGRDLFSSNEVCVPADALTLDRTRPNRFWQSSDGLASGNSDEEAIFHGLLERIERDAEVLWRLLPEPRRARTAVVPDNIDDPVIGWLTGRIEEAGFFLRLFDMTSDIGIPAFICLLAHKGAAEQASARYIDVTCGSGAHPVSARAVIRAITEAVQSRLTLISGTRDDIKPNIYTLPLPAPLRRELSWQPTCELRENFMDPGRDLTEMLKGVNRRLNEKGIDRAIAVRLNDPSLPLSVMRVLVPELESPDGPRAKRFGARAMQRMLTFR